MQHKGFKYLDLIIQQNEKMVIDQDKYSGGLEITDLKRFRVERALITEQLNSFIE